MWYGVKLICDHDYPNSSEVATTVALYPTFTRVRGTTLYPTYTLTSAFNLTLFVAQKGGKIALWTTISRRISAWVEGEYFGLYLFFYRIMFIMSEIIVLPLSLCQRVQLFASIKTFSRFYTVAVTWRWLESVGFVLWEVWLFASSILHLSFTLTLPYLTFPLKWSKAG